MDWQRTLHDVIPTVRNTSYQKNATGLLRRQCGFTILELLVVMAIMAVTLGLAYSGMSTVGPKYEVDNAVRKAMGGMAQARTHAITSGLTTHIDFGAVTSGYTIVETDASNQVDIQSLPSSVTTDGKVITFSSIGTLATGSDTALVLSRGSASRTITVSVTGEVSVS